MELLMEFHYSKNSNRPQYDKTRDGNVFTWILKASQELRNKEIEKKKNSYKVVMKNRIAHGTQ